MQLGVLLDRMKILERTSPHNTRMLRSGVWARDVVVVAVKTPCVSEGSVCQLVVRSR
jgi:hypothetical protein